MIDFLKIKDVISVLPLLIIYILPGYIFISVTNFVINKKQETSNNIVLKSIALSYIIINIESLILIKLPYAKEMDISDPRTIIITVFVAFIASYIYSRFIISESCDKTLKMLKINRSFKTDALGAIVDFKIGMWVRVFLTTDQIIYQGIIRRFEQITDDGDYFIVLSNFSLYNYKGKELDNNETDNTKWVAINLKDNYRIELYYSPDSEKIIG